MAGQAKGRHLGGGTIVGAKPAPVVLFSEPASRCEKRCTTFTIVLNIMHGVAVLSLNGERRWMPLLVRALTGRA